MDKITDMVEGWVKDGRFPGAVLEIAQGDKIYYQQAFGGYSDQLRVRAITLETMFDAASLTKVTATLPAVLLLASRGILALDDKVQRFLPQFRHKEVSLRHLLQHSSGLPADLPAVQRKVQRDVIGEIEGQELLFPPGRQVVYSDLGMILLGAVVERVTGKRLNELVEQEIFKPLGMQSSMYVPPSTFKHRIAPTEQYDGAYITGEVHDEKSWQLGGISGSAGLFTTAADLTKYARMWMEPGDEESLLPQRWREQCLQSPLMGRGLGWEVWPGFERLSERCPVPPPSCGDNWPAGSYGHTGFTGTSLWIEPRSRLSVVFMTNAVHYGRANPIRQLRPLLHQAIYSSLNLGI